MALYLVGSPIGNLKDITLRALENLENADFIYCEDTRVSQKLLLHYKIKKPLFSYHKHSTESKLKEILKLLQEGNDIAYLSDAGMPCISDPGKDLIKLAIENNIYYSIIPGVSASITAYAASSFDNNRFTFIGFLDRNNYKKELENLKNIENPIIIYEAPHRIEKLLVEVLNTLGDRNITVAREITKVYESFLHGKTSEIIEHREIKNPKGEFVLIIEGSSQNEKELSKEEIIEIAKKRLNEGEKISLIAKEMAKLGSLSRNEIYKILSEEI